jgi:SAM-dependent methyltransferase
MLAIAFQTAADVLNTLRGRTLPPDPIDRQYGIETSRRVPRRALASGAKEDAHSAGYLGCAPSIVRKALDQIGIEPGMTFVDIGCGKGRVLVVASDYPFAWLIGVELSRHVANLASRNFEKLRSPDDKFRRISLLRGDATKPPLQQGCNVLFFYNSFTGAPVKTLIESLRRHVTKYPTSKIWLIALNPVSFEAFDNSGFLHRYAAERIDATPEEAAAGNHPYDSVIIYQSGAAPLREPLPGAEAKVAITIPGIGADIGSA